MKRRIQLQRHLRLVRRHRLSIASYIALALALRQLRGLYIRYSRGLTLSGESCLITGASSGVGAAVAAEATRARRLLVAVPQQP